MAATTIMDEWLQLYEESLHAQDMLSTCSYELSDSAVVATSSFNSIISIESLDRSPTNSSTNNTTTPPSSGSATPNNKATCFSKPIRRRSRASKKTPTTHLSANTSNFRALVQKFTGCHKKPISFGTHRTPINLNFKLGRVQNHRSTSSKYINILPPSEENYQPCIEEQPQTIGWPMEPPRVDDLQLHGLITHEENNCIASMSLLNHQDDHQKVEYNDHPFISNNLETVDDDGFLWEGFDLHEHQILEESFSSEIVD